MSEGRDGWFCGKTYRFKGLAAGCGAGELEARRMYP